MNNQRWIFLIGCAAVLALGFMLKKCGKDNVPTIETTRTVDTIYIKSTDTYHEISTQPTKPIYITNNYTTEISRGPIDTMGIIHAYFDRRTYRDTIKNDSIEISLDETVYKNELTRNKVSYKWIAPTRLIKETITNNIYPNSLFIGGSVGYVNKLPTMGINVDYETKKLGYGAMVDPFQRSVYLKVSKRIKFKK